MELLIHLVKARVPKLKDARIRDDEYFVAELNGTLRCVRFQKCADALDAIVAAEWIASEIVK